MARRSRDDDLLMEDELTAAFLGEEDLAQQATMTLPLYLLATQPQWPTIGKKKMPYLASWRWMFMRPKKS